MRAVVDEIFVSFIGDDDQIAVLRKLRDRFCFFGSEHNTARVLWRVVVDRFRSLGGVARQCFLKTFFASFVRRYENAAALAVSN